jgi:ribosomal protein S18 acetylase RimI-like enzyme
MILAAFAPITWFRAVDRDYGPLNGLDWKARWNQRLDKVFATQILLVGTTADGAIAAAATGTADPEQKLGFVDLLAVDPKHHRSGYGRLMLNAMLDHFSSLGMQHAHLDCLTDNAPGNALYAAEGWSIVASHHHWFKKLSQNES